MKMFRIDPWPFAIISFINNFIKRFRKGMQFSLIGM